MIVIDASAMVDALCGARPHPELLDAIERDLHAPHLLDIEVMSVLRGLERGRRIDATAAEVAWHDFSDFAITRHAFSGLAARVWTLRHQFTTYDAAYLALAEALDAPLVTTDAKLATSGHGADVRVLRVGEGRSAR